MTNLSNLLVKDLKAVYGNRKEVKSLKKAELVDLVATSFERIGFKEDASVSGKIIFRADAENEMGHLIDGMSFSIMKIKGQENPFVEIRFHGRSVEVEIMDFMEVLASYMSQVSRYNSTVLYIKEQTEERGLNATITEYGTDSITVLISGESVKFGIGSEYSVMHVLNQHERFFEDDQSEELGVVESQVSPETEMFMAVSDTFPHARFEGLGEDDGYTYFFGSTALDKADMTICIFGKDGENKFSCTLEWRKEIHFDEHETVILSEKECVTPSEVVEFIRKESKKAYRKKKKNA